VQTRPALTQRNTHDAKGWRDRGRVYMCVHVCRCVFVYVYIYIWIYMHICIYIYTHVYIYMNIHIHVRIFIYMYMCIYICVHTCIYIYMYKHTATHCNAYTTCSVSCLVFYLYLKHCVELWCLNTLQHTATHCITLQHTATHCNTLQHTASHTMPVDVLFKVFNIYREHRVELRCLNTLQHTATHCNTLQHAHYLFCVLFQAFYLNLKCCVELRCLFFHHPRHLRGLLRRFAHPLYMYICYIRVCMYYTPVYL